MYIKKKTKMTNHIHLSDLYTIICSIIYVLYICMYNYKSKIIFKLLFLYFSTTLRSYINF